MKVLLNSLIFVVLIATAGLAVADSTNSASGEFFIKGLVSGAYQDTHQSDDVYESITEERKGNLSFLEHKWTFNVAGGDAVTFHVEAYKTDDGDHEDFVFAYSTDGAVFTDMVTVTNTVDTDTSITYSLPDDTKGIVFVRVRDSDQVTKNLKKQEVIHVDYMAIISTGEPPPPIDNLLINPGFEEGTAYWYGYDGISLQSSNSETHGGTNACYVSNRNYYWQGPIHDLFNTMARNHTYSNSIWIKLDNTNQALFTLTIKQTIDGSDVFNHLQSVWVTNTEWTQLSGFFTNSYEGLLSGLNMYIEGPPSGVTFYVDDALLQGSGDWETEANASIERIRKRDARVSVYDCFGMPISNATVDVVQKSHNFAFGSAMSSQVLSNPSYASFFTQHFEWAVFENETKWSEIESLEDDVSYTTPDAMYGFCVSNNIKMRGHCVFWSVENYIQEWVRDLAVSPDELMTHMSNHLDNTVSRYSEHFQHWDVNNEMLHGSFYSDLFGENIRPWMYERVQAVDPDVRLFVNDFGVLSYSGAEDYLHQIQGLISNGAPIGGIGAQCHMWELNPYLLLARLDILEQAGLPVWCSEFDIANADPLERARQLEIFYRAAFSHPSVEGILMWGFWANNHWRGPDAAIVDADWTTNAAGLKYEELMDEWTTVTSLTSDVDGEIQFRGFHGTYELTITTNTGSPVTNTLSLYPEAAGLDAILIVDGPDSDGDGIPDIWEQAYGLNVGVDDAGQDKDNDGFCNATEYAFATDPSDSDAYMQMEVLRESQDTHSVISFPSQPHRYYCLQYRTNLCSGAWSTLYSSIRGTGSDLVLTNESDVGSGYYRVGAYPPE